MYTITLPMPPSVNSMYRTGKNSKRKSFKTDAFLAWEASALEIIFKKRPARTYSEDVAYEYRFFPKNAKFGDCENRVKALTDILVKAGVIQDDKHTILKRGSFSFAGYDKENPRVEVMVG